MTSRRNNRGHCRHRDEMTRAATTRGIPVMFLNRHWADWRYNDICDILDYFQLFPRPDSGRETKVDKAARLYSFATRTPHQFPRSVAELASLLNAPMYLHPQIETTSPSRQPQVTVTALVDSGCSRNMFAYQMIDTFRFDSSGTQMDAVTGLTGHTMPAQGPYLISISLEDSQGCRLTGRLDFYAADIAGRGFDMILGMPWIVGQVCEINLRTRWWRFSENRLGANMLFPIAVQQEKEEEEELEEERDNEADDDEEEEEEDEDGEDNSEDNIPPPYSQY